LLAVEEPGKFGRCQQACGIVIALSCRRRRESNRTVFGRAFSPSARTEATARLCGIRVRWTQIASLDCSLLPERSSVSRVRCNFPASRKATTIFRPDRPRARRDRRRRHRRARSLNGGSGSVFGAVLARC